MRLQSTHAPIRFHSCAPQSDRAPSFLSDLAPSPLLPVRTPGRWPTSTWETSIRILQQASSKFLYALKSHSLILGRLILDRCHALARRFAAHNIRRTKFVRGETKRPLLHNPAVINTS